MIKEIFAQIYMGLGKVVHFGSMIYWVVMVVRTVLGHFTFWQGIALPSLFVVLGWLGYLGLGALGAYIAIKLDNRRSLKR